MISDSVPWREHLWKAATALEKRAGSVRWTERTPFLVERDVLNGMFAIRRLIEAAKTSSNTSGFPVARLVAVHRRPLNDRLSRQSELGGGPFLERKERGGCCDRQGDRRGDGPVRMMRL